MTLAKPGQAAGIRWSADGKLLWTMAAQPANGGFFTIPNQIIEFWEISSGKDFTLSKQLGHSAYTVAFHPNGKVLAAIHVPRAVDLVRSRVFRQGFSLSDEDRMETIRMWEIKSATPRLRFEDPVHRQLAEDSNAWDSGRIRPQPAAFAPDGRLFAAPGEGGIVLYQTVTGRPRLRLEGHLQQAVAFAFTPDSKALVSASPDSTILIWDLTGLKTLGKLEGTPEEHWALLADPSAERAGRAVWALVDAPTEALRLLRKWLKPVEANPKALQKMIDDLGAPTFAVRDRAALELAMHGPTVEEALSAKLSDRPTLELRRRLEKLLEIIRTGQPSAQHLQVIRGVEVLEHIGTHEAQAWLRELSRGDEGTWVTLLAREALTRLEPRMKRDLLKSNE